MAPALCAPVSWTTPPLFSLAPETLVTGRKLLVPSLLRNSSWVSSRRGARSRLGGVPQEPLYPSGCPSHAGTSSALGWLVLTREDSFLPHRSAPGPSPRNCRLKDTSSGRCIPAADPPPVLSPGFRQDEFDRCRQGGRHMDVGDLSAWASALWVHHTLRVHVWNLGGGLKSPLLQGEVIPATFSVGPKCLRVRRGSRSSSQFSICPKGRVPWVSRDPEALEIRAKRAPYLINPRGEFSLIGDKSSHPG